MPTSGGSATMYGILYQLLGAAHWAARIQLRVPINMVDWDTASLVIEPAGGGGDIQIVTPHCRIVEQWKAKSDLGAWSTRSIIKEVLPDLYRAVGDDIKLESEFRFVTEGHAGRYYAAAAFFTELRTSTCEYPLRELDNTKLERFLPNRSDTRQTFFRLMFDELRSHHDISAEAEHVAALKLQFLLGRFSIVGSRTAERLLIELNGMLRPLVDFAEQVTPKRRELCATLLEVAAKGDIWISPSELLSRVSLDHTAFSNWTRVRDVLYATASRIAHKRWGYRRDYDLRLGVNAQFNSLVHVVTGESGQGKSWRLARLALDAIENGALAVIVSSTGNCQKDLQVAATTIARDAFGRESPFDLDLLARKRREFICQLPFPWLTVYIDEVKSMAHARELIDQDWAGWGIRLVLSAFPPTAQALKTMYAEQVCIEPVNDFTTIEVAQYFDNMGYDWTALPIDVRTIVKKPLFARLYCEIAEDSTWRPTDEYALIDRYWQRIRIERDQVDFPLDLQVIRNLAGTLLSNDVSYPWPQRDCQGLGMSSEIFCRLEHIGWLRRAEGDHFEVSHDRLLNWAVADALVSSYLAHSISLETLVSHVYRFFAAEPDSTFGRQLGYVVMDTCWLLINRSDSAKHDLVQIILTLEQKHGPWRADGLYGSLLPTLGLGVVDSLVTRLELANRDADADSTFFVRQNISLALAKIGRQFPETIAEIAREMLETGGSVTIEVGEDLLKHFPTASALNKLWNAHLINSREFKREMRERAIRPYLRTRQSLISCVRIQPDWVRQRILEHESDGDNPDELAFLIAQIRGEIGRHIWLQAKHALFQRLPDTGHRNLALCISRHADRDEVSRLARWLTSADDGARTASFEALVHLAPQVALNSLETLPIFDLYISRSSWLPGLMLRIPDQTRKGIRSLAVSTSRSLLDVVFVYQDDPNEMDLDTLRLVLQEIEPIVEIVATTGDDTNANRLSRPLALLATVTSLSLVSELEAQIGTALERNLADSACRWIERTNSMAGNAIHVLTKIAGEGLTIVVNSLLSSTDKFKRLEGISLSFIRPDARTRRLLIEMTQSSETWDEQQVPLLQTEAMVALAALGEDRAFTDAILRWGMVLDRAASMRAKQPPISDPDLASVLVALESENETLRTNAVRALGVSGRTDFAPKVREILRHAVPESELALAAVIALDHFSDNHPDSIGLFKDQLRVGGHAPAASIALLRTGQQEAINILAIELQTNGFRAGVVVDDILAVNLGLRAEMRGTVAQIVWKHLVQNRQMWFGNPVVIECLAELKLPEVQEYLLEVAHSGEEYIHVVGQRSAAIRALSEFDRDAAFRAATSAFNIDGKHAEDYPRLLTEIDESRAVPVLFDFYSSDFSTKTKVAIARALRGVADRSNVQAKLTELFDSEETANQVIAIELAAWETDASFRDRIKELAINSSSHSVRRAAENAERRFRHDRQALELLDRIQQTSGVRCWSYVESVARLADPILLNEYRDQLYLWPSLSNSPTGLRRRATTLLEERKKSLDDEADRLDKKKLD